VRVGVGGLEEFIFVLKYIDISINRKRFLNINLIRNIETECCLFNEMLVKLLMKSP